MAGAGRHRTALDQLLGVGEAPVLGPKGGVLGLGRRSRGAPSDEPAWIGPHAGGLPDLATGLSNLGVLLSQPRAQGGQGRRFALGRLDQGRITAT